MQFRLLSQSKNTDLTRSVLEELADAVQEWLLRDVAPLHECWGAGVRVADDLAEVLPGESPIVVFDDADVAGALGYHDVTPTGTAYAKVFLQPILDNGGTIFGDLGPTIAHEAGEALLDPYVNLWAQIELHNAAKLCAWEIGDPVEEFSYPIGRVSVSNFVTPRWFRRGPGPYDKMGILSEPYTRTPGGYLILQEPGTEVLDGPDRTPGRHGRFVDWGPEVPAWKRAQKLGHPASRTRKRLGL